MEDRPVKLCFESKISAAKRRRFISTAVKLQGRGNPDQFLVSHGSKMEINCTTLILPNLKCVVCLWRSLHWKGHFVLFFWMWIRGDGSDPRASLCSVSLPHGAAQFLYFSETMSPALKINKTREIFDIHFLFLILCEFNQWDLALWRKELCFLLKQF